MEDAVICDKCGGEEYQYGMVMLPMVWAAVCVGCGAETYCHQKPSPPPKKPSGPSGWIDPFGFWHPI